MTCARETLSLEEIIAETIKITTDAQVRLAIGKSANWLSKCGNPNGQSELSMKDAVALDNLLSALGHPRKFSDYWARETMTPDEYVVDCFLHQLARFTAESGKLGAALHDAYEDGHIDEKERAEISRAAIGAKNELNPFVVKPSALDLRNGYERSKVIRRTAQKIAGQTT